MNTNRQTQLRLFVGSIESYHDDQLLLSLRGCLSLPGGSDSPPTGPIVWPGTRRKPNFKCNC
ncbi:unnamed protein product [Protopolystoma xenopodis]|uniref:Uncharacterized protein n=1 Tax=Protopolystoma xenopodis TaxID=117903 RepID=A0A448X8X4_9PLAT|nr:unnamed protein product [Protopolystoma xenopodis]